MHECGMVTAADIHRARRGVGESQAAFARRFGVNQSTIDRWEKSGPPNRGPGLLLIERILAELSSLPRSATAPDTAEAQR